SRSGRPRWCSGKATASGSTCSRATASAAKATCTITPTTTAAATPSTPAGSTSRTCSCRSFRADIMAAKIAILDDDHINRLIRYAIAGPGEVTQDWAEHFFLPEDIDTARVRAFGEGLRRDGVTLAPMATDAREGTDAQVLIFRRGVI